MSLVKYWVSVVNKMPSTAINAQYIKAAGYKEVYLADEVEAVLKPMRGILEDYCLMLRILLARPAEESNKEAAREAVANAKRLLAALNGGV